MQLGPSFSGTTAGSRFVGNSRMQWPTISKPFYASAVAIDHNFVKYKSGAGLIFQGDMAGQSQLNRTKVGLQYTYNVEITSKFHFRPGIEVSFNRVGINYGNLVFGDEIYYNLEQSNEAIAKPDRMYPDAALSGLFFTAKYWGGLSMFHLMQPNESLSGEDQTSKLPIKTTVYAGGKTKISGRIGRKDEESVFYGFLYRSQEKYDQFDLGAYWYKVPIMLGGWYRGIPGFKKNPDNALNHDAFMILVGFKKETFSAAYSYDVTISRLFLDSGGAHELSISYYFNQDYNLNRRQKRLTVPCPRF